MALNALLVAVLIYFAALAVNDVIGAYRGTDDAPVHPARLRRSRTMRSRTGRARHTRRSSSAISSTSKPPPAPPPQVVEEDLHLTLIGVTQPPRASPTRSSRTRSASNRSTRSATRFPIPANCPKSRKIVCSSIRRQKRLRSNFPPMTDELASLHLRPTLRPHEGWPPSMRHGRINVFIAAPGAVAISNDRSGVATHERRSQNFQSITHVEGWSRAETLRRLMSSAISIRAREGSKASLR